MVPDNDVLRAFKQLIRKKLVFSNLNWMSVLVLGDGKKHSSVRDGFLGDGISFQLLVQQAAWDARREVRRMHSINQLKSVLGLCATSRRTRRTNTNWVFITHVATYFGVTADVHFTKCHAEPLHSQV